MNDLAVRSVKDNIIENGEKRILAMQTEIERLKADLARVQWGQLQAENAALRATQERMWCKSCGTVTRTGECDCTRMETGTQALVNYADSLQGDIDDLRATEARLRAALKTVRVYIKGELIWDAVVMVNGKVEVEVEGGFLTLGKLVDLACEQEAPQKDEPSEVTVRRMRAEWPDRQT